MKTAIEFLQENIPSPTYKPNYAEIALLMEKYVEYSNGKKNKDLKKETVLREPLIFFAKKMEEKLIKNDKKGGWNNCSYDELQNFLNQEVIELKKAIEEGNPVSIINEAADVANFSMMISDNTRKSIKLQDRLSNNSSKKTKNYLNK